MDWAVLFIEAAAPVRLAVRRHGWHAAAMRNGGVSPHSPYHPQ